MFLHGARTGWRARDLENWLATHYAAVTVRLDGAHDEASPESELGPRNVEELVELVGIAVTAALRELDTNPSSIIDGVLRAGAVIALENDDGPMWMPVDRPSLDIETRVLSLFATDYLLDPDAYEEELCVCADCEQVSFDAFGQCPTCSTSQSGVRRMSSLLDELEAGIGETAPIARR